MAEKKKNPRRRLIILLAAVVLLCAAAGGAYAYRKHRIHKQFMAWRAEGMEAASKSDAPRAVDLLGRYLVRYGNDVPALLEYARCRDLAPLPDPQQQMGESIRVARHILRLAPDKVDVRRKLMERYVEVRYWTEAFGAAEQILGRRVTRTTWRRWGSLRGSICRTRTPPRPSRRPSSGASRRRSRSRRRSCTSWR